MKDVFDGLNLSIAGGDSIHSRWMDDETTAPAVSNDFSENDFREIEAPGSAQPHEPYVDDYGNSFL